MDEEKLIVYLCKACGATYPVGHASLSRPCGAAGCSHDAYRASYVEVLRQRGQHVWVCFAGEAHLVSGLSDAEVSSCMDAIRTWNRVAAEVAADPVASEAMKHPPQPLVLRRIWGGDRAILEELAARWFAEKDSVLDLVVR